MCQPVINPAGRVRELSPSSLVVPSGAPQFGSWLPSPLPSRELAPGYRGAGRNIWVSRFAQTPNPPAPLASLSLGSHIKPRRHFH